MYPLCSRSAVTHSLSPVSVSLSRLYRRILSQNIYILNCIGINYIFQITAFGVSIFIEITKTIELYINKQKCKRKLFTVSFFGWHLCHKYLITHTHTHGITIAVKKTNKIHLFLKWKTYWAKLTCTITCRIDSKLKHANHITLNENAALPYHS